MCDAKVPAAGPAGPCKRRVVEARGALDVQGAQGDVVEHGCDWRFMFPCAASPLGPQLP
jgi:hypothetical protein